VLVSIDVDKKGNISFFILEGCLFQLNKD